MRKILFSFIFIVTISLSGFSQESHKIFNDLLGEYVKVGIVDYQGLSKDRRLSEYINFLKTTNPNLITSESELLAFWTNAYNAYTLKIIVDNYPLKSIKDINDPIWRGGKTVWDKELVIIDGRKMSLNHIEHKIIRPKFLEPRVHFALVCAARGCTPLRAEVYKKEIIDFQLNDQAQVFLSNKNKNNFDLKNKIANISAIFKWYKDDFGNSEKEVLQYIIKFLPNDLAEIINSDIDLWKIKYTHYDWSLNGS